MNLADRVKDAQYCLLIGCCIGSLVVVAAVIGTIATGATA